MMGTKSVDHSFHKMEYAKTACDGAEDHEPEILVGWPCISEDPFRSEIGAASCLLYHMGNVSNFGAGDQSQGTNLACLHHGSETSDSTSTRYEVVLDNLECPVNRKDILASHTLDFQHVSFVVGDYCGGKRGPLCLFMECP
jgi:hypothetical protein